VTYHASDLELGIEVAIKMEKQDKARKILRSEYEFLRKLKNREGVIQVFDFVSQEEMGKQNFIVMELKGKNLASYKKNCPKAFQDFNIINLLLQMLTSIESVHSSGLIHRDIKPSNFVLGRNNEDKNKVYLVDFGLAKEHLNAYTMEVNPARRHTDFRGTIPYASLSAHMKEELGRKDDLWSFFFVVLEFLDIPLPWK
jgi:tau tubulin kinase